MKGGTNGKVQKKDAFGCSGEGEGKKREGDYAKGLRRNTEKSGRFAQPERVTLIGYRLYIYMSKRKKWGGVERDSDMKGLNTTR